MDNVGTAEVRKALAPRVRYTCGAKRQNHHCSLRTLDGARGVAGCEEQEYFSPFSRGGADLGMGANATRSGNTRIGVPWTA